jgi:hypothetical protein
MLRGSDTRSSAGQLPNANKHLKGTQMEQQTPPTSVELDADALLIKAPLASMGLSLAYSAALAWLERRYPIKPDHTWAEVTGGVLLTLVPVALEARKHPTMDWRMYENAVWRSFIASGAPIVLWQIGEAVFRQIELVKYASSRDSRSPINDAYPTTSLAFGGGTRAGGSPSSGDRSDPTTPDSPATT